jgi:hypothetical protein
MDRFVVEHGYKERSSVQIRLEGDGTVYLNDTRESRHPDQYITAKVPFKLFAEEWPRFIEFLAAKAHEQNENADSS